MTTLLLCIVDRSVYNGIADRALGFGIGVDTGIPASWLELCTEDGRAVPCASFDRLPYGVSLLRSETANEPFFQDQQIDLLVSPHDFFQLLMLLGNHKFLQKFQHILMYFSSDILLYSDLCSD